MSSVLTLTAATAKFVVKTTLRKTIRTIHAIDQIIRFLGESCSLRLAMLFVFGVVVACTFTYPSFERIQGFSVSGEQGERLTASASIEVANDWIVPITAHDLHFSIGYGGQVFAQGKVNESILLKSKAATAITAQTSLDRVCFTFMEGALNQGHH